MADGTGASPFILPSMFGAPGDALQNTINMRQREKDRQYEIDWRNQRQQEADEYRKYSVVKDTIDLNDLVTNNATAQDWFNQEGKRVFNEIVSDPKLINLPFVELYGEIQKRWQPVVQGAGMVKNGLASIDAYTKAAGTENKNIATDTLAATAKAMMIDDIMPVGADGKRTYNIANYRPEKNYVMDILNSKDRWRFMQGGGALIDYIKNFKTTEINPHKMLRDKSVIPYKGRQTPFVKLNVTPDEIGRLKESDNPQYDVATEDDFITEGDKRIPIKVLDRNTYQQHIEGIPANRDALDVLWNQYKEQNGLVSKNDTEDEKRKRAFAVGIFKLNDPSEITSLTPQHLPRNTTNNYINTGGGEKGVNPVDLSGYDKTEGGFYDITEMFRGVNFGKVGETLSSDRVLYNPNSRKFMYIDPATKEVSPVSKEVQPVTKEKDFTTFIQDISTSNPQADLKFIKGLGLSAGRSKTETPKQKLNSKGLPIIQ